MTPKSREMEKRETLLHSLLVVDGSIPGGLRWRVPNGHHYLGKPAGNDQGSGYWQVTIHGVKLKSSRVVWILMYGQIPDDKQVDHKDGKRSNNHPTNLQLLSQPPNGRGYNKLFPQNKSGYMGVSYQRDRGNWLAAVKRDGKHKSLGRFGTAKEAAAAYNEFVIAWAKEHGETPRYLNPV
jgi:HNH endonuclease